MKRKFKILSFLIFTFCSLFFLISCVDKEAKVVDVQISEESPKEVLIGAFDYSNYQLVITYDNDTTETITLDESMVSFEDYLKTLKEGKQSIAINYNGFETTLELDMKRYEFQDDIYLVDTEYTYDGSYHSLEVTGNIPEGTKIVYTNGNIFKDAQIYTIKAYLTNDLYVSKTITGKLTIKKAEYDTSNLVFKDKEVVYDGKAHSIEIENAPKDLNITYSIADGGETNEMTQAGTYKVLAHIDAGVNYGVVKDLEATLTILKADYDLSAYKFNDKTVTYSGEIVSLHVSGEDSLSKSGIRVIYENNENINAGEYEVIARFVGDEANYNPIEPKYATLTIKKAKIKLEGVYLDSESFSYDGKAHSIYFKGDLPSGVSFAGYENNAQINAGLYTVLANFNYRDQLNFEPIDPIEGYLEITKSDITGIVFENRAVEYTGNGFSLSCSNVPAGVVVSYTYDGVKKANVKEPKEYKVVATFSFDETAANNYNPLSPMEATLTITKKTLQASFVNQTYVYDNTYYTLTCELTDFEAEYVDVNYFYYNAESDYVPFISAKEPGSYLIFAEFTYKSDELKDEFLAHYNELTRESAFLYILKRDYVPVFTNQKLEYKSGVEQEVIFDVNELPGLIDYEDASYDPLTVINPHLEFDNIAYINNKQVEPGIYELTAKFYLSNNAKKYYNDIPDTKVMYAIRKANAQVVIPQIDNGTVVYDGAPHSISVANVPYGIDVSYQNNSQTMPGVHSVSIIFTFMNDVVKYYYSLPVGTGTYYQIAGEDYKVYCSVKFEILKQPYILSYTNTQPFTYTGENQYITLVNDVKWIQVEYEYAEETRIKPGTYTVTCKPTIIDSEKDKIYEVSEDTVQFTIEKADVMFSYSGLTVYYDGLPHDIEVLGVPTDEGVSVKTIGGNKVSPGTYDVQIVFTNESDCYNDIDSQVETLTILNNNVSTAGLITYVDTQGVKYIDQLQTLRKYLASWFEDGIFEKAFNLDFEVDYFLSPGEEYPSSDKKRHGSSIDSNDFLFEEPTSGSEYVIVTFKITFKEGYVCGDQSMEDSYTGMIQFSVGKAVEIDISKLRESFYDHATVVEGTSMELIFKYSIPQIDYLTVEYVADYYIDGEIYSGTLVNVHGESKNGADYTFTTSTWGNRYCVVKYKLTPNKGYCINDGVDKSLVYENTVFVTVNTANVIDMSFFESFLEDGIHVKQYSELSHELSLFYNSSLTTDLWNLYDENGDLVGDQMFGYILSEAKEYTLNLKVTPDYGYSLSSDNPEEYSQYTLKVIVDPLEAVDFSGFEEYIKLKGNYKTDTYSLRQYDDLFTDVFYDLEVPAGTTCKMTVHDFNGKEYVFNDFDSYYSYAMLDDSYTKAKFLTIDFDFYANPGSVVLDSRKFNCGHRAFTYNFYIKPISFADTTFYDRHIFVDGGIGDLSYVSQYDTFNRNYSSLSSILESYIDMEYSIEFYKEGTVVDTLIQTFGSFDPSKDDFEFNDIEYKGIKFDYFLVNFDLSIDPSEEIIFDVNNKYNRRYVGMGRVIPCTILNDTVDEQVKQLGVVSYNSYSTFDSVLYNVELPNTELTYYRFYFISASSNQEEVEIHSAYKKDGFIHQSDPVYGHDYYIEVKLVANYGYCFLNKDNHYQVYKYITIPMDVKGRTKIDFNKEVCYTSATRFDSVVEFINKQDVSSIFTCDDEDFAGKIAPTYYSIEFLGIDSVSSKNNYVSSSINIDFYLGYSCNYLTIYVTYSIIDPSYVFTENKYIVGTGADKEVTFSVYLDCTDSIQVSLDYINMEIDSGDWIYTCKAINVDGSEETFTVEDAASVHDVKGYFASGELGLDYTQTQPFFFSSDGKTSYYYSKNEVLQPGAITGRWVYKALKNNYFSIGANGEAIKTEKGKDFYRAICIAYRVDEEKFVTKTTYPDTRIFDFEENPNIDYNYMAYYYKDSSNYFGSLKQNLFKSRSTGKYYIYVIMTAKDRKYCVTGSHLSNYYRICCWSKLEVQVPAVTFSYATGFKV